MWTKQVHFSGVKKVKLKVSTTIPIVILYVVQNTIYYHRNVVSSCRFVVETHTGRASQQVHGLGAAQHVPRPWKSPPAGVSMVWDQRC